MVFPFLPLAFGLGTAAIGALSWNYLKPRVLHLEQQFGNPLVAPQTGYFQPSSGLYLAPQGPPAPPPFFGAELFQPYLNTQLMAQNYYQGDSLSAQAKETLFSTFPVPVVDNSIDLISQYIYYFHLGQPPPSLFDPRMILIKSHIHKAINKRKFKKAHFDFFDKFTDLGYIFKSHGGRHDPQDSNEDSHARDAARAFMNLEQADPDINLGNNLNIQHNV